MPKPKNRRNRGLKFSVIGSLCKKTGCSGIISPWDCHCAWGCDCCYINATCNVCGEKYSGHRVKNSLRIDGDK